MPPVSRKGAMPEQAANGLDIAEEALGEPVPAVDVDDPPPPPETLREPNFNAGVVPPAST